MPTLWHAADSVHTRHFYRKCDVLEEGMPWSVDSLNGGSTDAFKKAPVEKMVLQSVH